MASRRRAQAGVTDVDPVGWLLASDEPAMRRLARRDLLGHAVPDAAPDLMAGPLVSGLLAGQRPDGGFGGHPYAKWGGSFWRVVALVELGVPAGEPRTIAAARNALDWVTGPDRYTGAGQIAGRERRHAAQEGLVLAALARLGRAGEPVAVRIAEQLVSWQWPDGGWNCDPRPTARRSSHESLWPAWGCSSPRTQPGKARHVMLPCGLLTCCSNAGSSGRRPRSKDALELLERRRLRDGRWRPGGTGGNLLDAAAVGSRSWTGAAAAPAR
jgi:hypothetical protein